MQAFKNIQAFNKINAQKTPFFLHFGKLIASLRDGFAKGCEAVQNADIVSSATIASCPIIKGEWIKQGTHVDLIDSFSQNTRESDDVLIFKSKIYIDNPVALLQSDDLTKPIEQGIICEDAIMGTLSDFRQKAHNLQKQNDHADNAFRDETNITIFKNVGSALRDLFAAKLAYA